MARSPGFASGMRTLKSATAGPALASVKIVPAVPNMKMLRIRVSNRGSAPVDRGRLRLDGCRRSGLAWRGGWHASRHAHQATDAEQRTEVEHDLDTGRLCRITDQYV